MIEAQKIHKAGVLYYRVRDPRTNKTQSWSTVKHGTGLAKLLSTQAANDINKNIDQAVIETESPIVGKSIQDLIASREGKVEDSTYRQMKIVLARWEKTKLWNMKIKQVNVVDMEAAEKELKAFNYSDDAIDRSVTRLKEAAKKSEKTHNFKNRIALYEFEKSIETKHRVIERPIPDQADVKLLLNQADGYLAMYILIAITTGLRPSEIRGLKWENVKYSLNQIWVRSKADENNVVSNRLKNKNAIREVPLVPQLADALFAWQEANKGKHNPKDLVLHTRLCNPLPHNQISQSLDKLKTKLGITGWVGLHSFRHFYASMLLKRQVQLGLDFKQIPTILGHKDFGFTASVYGHSLDTVEDKQQISQSLAAAFSQQISL